MSEESSRDDDDDICLGVYNSCSLMFWSLFVAFFESILLVLSLPFSTLEAVMHFIQIASVLIGLVGLYNWRCYHHFIRFYSIMAWPLTFLTVFGLFHYSDQLTFTEIANAMSFYFPGIELAIAYAMGLLEQFAMVFIVFKFLLLWSYGMGTVAAMFGWQNATSSQFIYFDSSHLDTWISIIVHLLTIFLGVDLEDFGHIATGKQLVEAILKLIKNLFFSSDGLSAELQALLGKKKGRGREGKGGKGFGDVQAKWHRPSHHV